MPPIVQWNHFSKKQTVVTVVWLSVLSIVTVVCLVNFIFSLNRTFTSEAENYLQDLNTQISATISDSFSRNFKQLASIASLLMSEKDLCSESVLKNLAHQALLNGQKRLGIGMPDGSYYTSEGSLDNIAHRKYFQSALKGEPYFEYIPQSVISNGPVIAFGVPIYDSTNTVRAVLVGIHEQDTIQNMINVTGINSSWMNCIILSTGEFIWVSGESALWKHTTEKNIYEIASRFDVKKGSAALQIKKICAEGLSGIYPVTYGDSGYYFAYTPSIYEDWFLFSLIPDETLNHDSRQFLYFILRFAFSILLLLLGYWGVFFAMGRINRKKFYEFAYNDSLLNVPNRSWFNATTTPLISSAQLGTYAYVILDIENFKLLNERFGYESGNEMLRHVYTCITAMMQQGEYASRIAFDDFNMLLIFESGHCLKQRLQMLSSSINTFSKKLESNYFVLIRYGVYIIDDSKIADPNVCYDRAKIALHVARQKLASKMSKIGFYHERDHELLKRNKDLENKMESALASGHFLVYLQPKYNIETNTVAGAEALIRWRDPEKGLLLPADFIPLFEQNGMIHHLDLFVFTSVCSMIRKWQNAGIEPIPVSVNLSRAYIANDKFLHRYEEIRQKYDVPSQYIELELTETMVFDNLAQLRNLIDEIHSYGYSCSIDDFGAGYSSLNVLKDVKVDTIKLDKAFFDHYNDDKTDTTASIIECIINLAHKLNMKTVSEGVESFEQIDFLRSLRCNMVQGYVYAKPLPVSEFEQSAFGQMI